jgi:hypothetical protein
MSLITEMRSANGRKNARRDDDFAPPILHDPSPDRLPGGVQVGRIGRRAGVPVDSDQWALWVYP